MGYAFVAQVPDAPKMAGGRVGLGFWTLKAAVRGAVGRQALSYAAGSEGSKLADRG